MLGVEPYSRLMQNMKSRCTNEGIGDCGEEEHLKRFSRLMGMFHKMVAISTQTDMQLTILRADENL